MEEITPLMLALAPTHILRIGVSLVCGVLLGLERERRDKPAGLRTIVLITVGSTLFTLLSEAIGFMHLGPPETIRIDPARIAAQVVSGIGFLGAGSIIQSRGSVHGLTTAATIWVAAAVGMCIGLGFLITGLATCLIVLGILILLDPLADKIRDQGRRIPVRFHSPVDSLTVETVRLLLLEHRIALDDVHTEDVPEGKLWVINSRLRGHSQLHLLQALRNLEVVKGLPLEDPGHERENG